MRPPASARNTRSRTARRAPSPRKTPAPVPRGRESRIPETARRSSGEAPGYSWESCGDEWLRNGRNGYGERVDLTHERRGCHDACKSLAERVHGAFLDCVDPQLFPGHVPVA